MSALHGGFLLHLKGPSIVNNGFVNDPTRINGDTNQMTDGFGYWKGGGEFAGAGEKTISNMHVSVRRLVGLERG